MTTLPSTTGMEPAPPPPDSTKEMKRQRFINRSKLILAIWLLMLPTVGGMIVFNYTPKFDAVWYSFFEWDGLTHEEFVGWDNYVKVWNMPQFWEAFGLVMILFLANLVKMWPSIFAAVVLNRLKSGRARYFYQVLFVIPMVIPGLVWLLIWKSFYSPNDGLLNRFLNMTHLMDVLAALDAGWPKMAGAIMPVRTSFLDLPFGNPFGLILFGGCILLALAGPRSLSRRWFAWVLAAIFGFALVPKSPPLEGAAWPDWFLAIAPYRWMMIIILGGLIGMLLSRGGPKGTNLIDDPTRKSRAIGRSLGIPVMILGGLLVATTMFWTKKTGTFEQGSPAWLGNPHLVVPAVIFWGFPWVGTVGVLLYLAALQGISTDVYEAAELDGVGWWGKFLHIELPLMLTMVRINLIFMTIHTLNDYGLFYILLGSGGGPDGAGNVPGLIMFRTAFDDVQFGLACAMGMYLFVMILILTVIYQKYIRVEK